MLFRTCFCIFIAAIFLSGEQYSNKANHNRIIVIGIALNSKGAAIVETDTGFYLVDGLEEWDKKHYGKKVKVTGRLKVQTYKQRSTYPGEFQERIGAVQIIKNPKWELII